MTYESIKAKAPKLAGGGLKLVAGLAESPLTAGLLRGNMLGQVGIDLLRDAALSEVPVPLPRHPVAAGLEPAGLDLSVIDRLTSAQGPPETAADFVRVFLSGEQTPRQVAERVVQAIEASDRDPPPLKIFIAADADDLLRQADASTRRYAQGAPLGPLDGVPIAVKDELDVTGYPTTVGTAFLGEGPCAHDATTVARLRAAGAMIIGKTNMHEIGLGMTGINPHHGAVRNPHNPDHGCAGSSSGSAAAVAAGLCPIAVGCDGGGSIRVPAAFCGVVGLKGTFGRLSEIGAAPLTWSMGHVGPLASSARDAALAYAIMAGPDPADPMTLPQPPVELERLERRDLSDLSVGVYRPWFEDAATDIVEAGNRLLDGLRQAGATVREVEIPELRLFYLAHLVTIASEIFTSQRPHYRADQKRYGGDTRLNLALAQGLSAADYVQAQRLRARAMRVCDEVLHQVDVVLTPAAAITAPPIPKAAIPGGLSDLEQLSEIMRFATLPNLTGLPAITFPAGRDRAGLPIGYQAIGGAWRESTLLRLAYAAEAITPWLEPQRRYRLLAQA